MIDFFGEKEDECELAVILYYRIHLWQSSKHCSDEKLLEKVKQDPNIIYLLTREELEIIVGNKNLDKDWIEAL